MKLNRKREENNSEAEERGKEEKNILKIISGQVGSRGKIEFKI